VRLGSPKLATPVTSVASATSGTSATEEPGLLQLQLLPLVPLLLVKGPAEALSAPGASTKHDGDVGAALFRTLRGFGTGGANSAGRYVRRYFTEQKAERETHNQCFTQSHHINSHSFYR
jgi:hypothetical protein